jgi:hypothetical protein
LDFHHRHHHHQICGARRIPVTETTLCKVLIRWCWSNLCCKKF